MLPFVDSDSLMHSCISSTNWEAPINYNFNKLNEWAKLWLVDFNPKKTSALIITNIECPDLDLKFDNKKMKL